MQSQKVPNVLTFSLMVIGVAAQWWFGQGVVYGLTGLGAAFAIHFALYVLGLEGAGDAKLMMGVGALIGWNEMIEATIWRYVFHVPFAVIVLSVKGRWANFMAAARWTMDKARGVEVGERPEPTYMPFAPLILVGTIAALSSEWLDFIG